MKDYIEHQNKFEEYIFELIRLKISSEYPEYFVISHTTVDDMYNSCIQCASNWFIKVLNGTLKTGTNYKWQDSYYYKIGKEAVYKERKRLIDDLMKSDIRIWCIENIYLN